MKKKILTIFMVMIMTVTSLIFSGIEVNAEEVGEDLDFSYLLTDEVLIGYAETQARGVYLAEGYSLINKLSTSKIGAGGITNAAVKCKVSITSIVERKNASGSWVRVTSWTNTVESGYSAAISKSLTVGTGYYYRVRSSHYASSDVSSSYTDALKM